MQNSYNFINEIDGASLYWYAEKKEGCPYEKETVALPEPAPADRLCRGSIHDANAEKTQNANGKCTAYSELERKILQFSGERAIKQATFQTWSLTKDGAWEPIGTPEELMHEKSKASFALSVGNDIRDGYNVAVADDAFQKAESGNFAPVERSIATMPWERRIYWTDGGAVVYGQPIPLLYQMDAVYCYEEFHGDLWKNPKEFLEMGWQAYTEEDWHISCITVTFEQE